MDSTQTQEESIPVRWWTHAPNFGDLLAPWLAEKISGRRAVGAKPTEPHYMIIGSILSYVRSKSVVWGVGSFGTEDRAKLAKEATYLAVRGPLTRNKLRTGGIECPAIYGDPALLVPDFYPRRREPSFEMGVVLRWSETAWNRKFNVPGVKKVYLRTEAIEETLDEILDCKRIVSSSLHGLIIADAYDIPNAWLDSRTPMGLDYKYWDYLISVGKVRHPQKFNLLRTGLTCEQMIEELNFDGRPMQLDLEPLRQACPFWPR